MTTSVKKTTRTKHHLTGTEFSKLKPGALLEVRWKQSDVETSLVILVDHPWPTAKGNQNECFAVIDLKEQCKEFVTYTQVVRVRGEITYDSLTFQRSPTSKSVTYFHDYKED